MIPKRVIRGWTVLFVLFVWSLYGRSLWWGWLDFDDKALVQMNPHLGVHSLANLWWALTDISFGRRWTPLLWLCAWIPFKVAWQFHVLVLCLASVLAGSMLRLLVREGGLWVGVVLTAMFLASPLRLEVFTWNMGFVYCLTAVFVCWCWLSDGVWSRFLWAWCAVLTYPVAGGCLVWELVRNRRSGAALVSVVGLFAYVALQYAVRRQIGFIPWHTTYQWLPWVVCHYHLMLVFPWVTSPVFPPGFYPLLAVGAGVFGFWLACDWRSCLWCLLILSPVLAASVTESFWFGARYSLLFEMAVCVVLARLLGVSKVHPGHLLVLWVGVGLSCVLTSQDRVFAHGDYYALDKTVEQCEAVGGNARFYRLILGKLSAEDRRLMQRYPKLAYYFGIMRPHNFLPPEAVGRGSYDLRDFRVYLVDNDLRLIPLLKKARTYDLF